MNALRRLRAIFIDYSKSTAFHDRRDLFADGGGWPHKKRYGDFTTTSPQQPSSALKSLRPSPKGEGRGTLRQSEGLWGEVEKIFE
jgi:hypothetical protein